MYDEEFNTTLIFVCALSVTRQLSNSSLKAGLFSAISLAFIIDVQSKCEPTQTIAQFSSLPNQSAVPCESPTVPPVPADPPSEIVTVSGLMYASLPISLLATFTATPGKQRLNRYFRCVGESTIERCGDRQRKRDGFARGLFHMFVGSLQIMLQVPLSLLLRVDHRLSPDG